MDHRREILSVRGPVDRELDRRERFDGDRRTTRDVNAVWEIVE
jgi:hypothetical protein